MVFSVSVVNLINTLFIAGGIAVCGLCFLQITASKHIRKDVRRYFQIFFAFIILYIASHLARQTMDGIEGQGIRISLYVITFIEMVAAGFMAFMMSLLVSAVAIPNKKKKPIDFALLGIFIAHVIVLSACMPFDFIFTFDNANVYHRGAGYLLSNLCPIVMLIIDMVLLIRFNKNIERKLKTALWNYMISPLVAVGIQTFTFGIQFIIFATVGAAIYTFGVIVQHQNESYEQQKIENSRIESELTLASNIQADMLPNIYPAFPDRKEFDIYAKMDPAKEVGGDFYDFFLVDDDHLCMVMADVSGKGVPAALFMMASKIILANNAMLGKSPAQILTDTNAAICSNNREEMFVTVWLGILEISTGKLTASNAGHEYPVLMKANGEFEIVKDKHGFVIGGMDGSKYLNYEITMEPGARLFLYTDGVPEATNGEGSLFGLDRMLKVLNKNKSVHPDVLLKNVRAAVDEFVNGAEQFDDITMLGFEYIGEQK